MAKPYFATLPPEELAAEIIRKKDDYYKWVLNYRLERWRAAYNTYYGQRGLHRSDAVSAAGKQGELSFLMSNEFRSIVQQIIVYTTKNKPSIEPACINSDAASQAAAILGKQVLEYIAREQKIEQLLKQSLEIAMIADSAWIFSEFDFTRGQVKMLHPETMRPINQGETVCSVRTPLDVVIDYTVDNSSQYDWQIKIDLVNKYDLAAQYPEIAEEIIGVTRDLTEDMVYRFGEEIHSGYEIIDSPLIRRYSFYHKNTPSVQNGRFFQCLDSKVILTKDYAPFQYDNLPGTRVCPSEMIGSCMGYSNTNDLLALQDVVDALVSSAVTNMTTFGVNNIWTKPNSGLDFDQLTRGIGHIQAEEEPKILKLNALPPEWLNLVNFIIQRMESISGINSVARGNTSGKDYSGAAMALLQSMAIEFNSGMQMSANSTLESVFNNILSNLQKFGDSEMEALVVGNNKRYLVKKFVGKDLANIKRVYIQQSNPFKDTTAGKMALVEYLMKFPNAIKYPDQIQQVLTTGSLDIVLEPQQKQNICIQEENERLSRGEHVTVVWTENHPAHLAEHLPLTWDSDTKEGDGVALAAADDHIQQHLQIWQSLTPDRLAVIGIPPFPMPIMPAPMPGQPALDSGGTPGNMPTEKAGLPKENPADQPSMPTNPLTGQEFNTNTGGMQ